MTRPRAEPANAPLLAWADGQRPAERPLWRGRWIAMSAAAAGLVGVTLIAPPTPRLVWNATASAPVGLYWIERDASFETGDIALAWAPSPARRLAAGRGYLSFHVPLVKAVGAIAGDDVCAFGQEILINGVQAGDRRLADRSGRPLPGWSGCVRLRGRAVFLFSHANPDSYDGRYFGVTRGADLLGKAHPLWLR